MLRHRELHGRGIDRLGGRGADEIVDRGRDALGGGEIGIAQREAHIGQAVERELDLALDDGAVGDAADGRHAAGDLGGVAFGREAADRDRALRHRIDVAVGAEQRRHQQGAALQALGVAERRDGDVDAGALGAERRQVGGHHHGRDVAGAELGAADVDAEPLQHRLQRLLGEGDVVERVAGAVEADDEAVADQLVLAHALDVGEVLDARGGLRRSKRRARSINLVISCSPRVRTEPAPCGIACHAALPIPPLNCKGVFSDTDFRGRGPSVSRCRAGQFLPAC